MAHLNTPAHDFAPPWLKIPSYDTSKPPGADSGGHASRREQGHGFGSARLTKEPDIFDAASTRFQYPNDLRRERNTFSGERKSTYFPSQPPPPLDAEDAFFDMSSVHTHRADNGFSSATTSSSFALLRRPHSRHDFRNIPASYAKGESFNRHMTNSTPGSYGNQLKSKFLDSSTNSNSIYNDNGGINASSNNFNQEFPSLQGGISEEHVSPLPTVNGGVWEKPRNMKVHSGSVGKKIQLIKKPISLEPAALESSKKSLTASLISPGSTMNTSGAPSSVPNSPHTVIVTPVVAKGGGSGGGIYRALVPAKSTIAKKSPTLTKEAAPKAVVPIKKPPSSTPPPSTHSMEILVKHPKAPGNKSEFLKALRNENKMLEENEKEDDKSMQAEMVNQKHEQTPTAHTNGIDIVKTSVDNENDKPLLSSSLEAEQRLLKEMGWKEDVSDDDNYAPLTEDELSEFRVLSEQIKERAVKNGFRRSIQANFSPRRIAPFSNVTLPTTDSYTSSSESDDSDY